MLLTLFSSSMVGTLALLSFLVFFPITCRVIRVVLQRDPELTQVEWGVGALDMHQRKLFVQRGLFRWSHGAVKLKWGQSPLNDDECGRSTNSALSVLVKMNMGLHRIYSMMEGTSHVVIPI